MKLIMISRTLTCHPCINNFFFIIININYYYYCIYENLNEVKSKTFKLALSSFVKDIPKSIV